MNKVKLDKKTPKVEYKAGDLFRNLRNGCIYIASYQDDVNEPLLLINLSSGTRWSSIGTIEQAVLTDGFTKLPEGAKIEIEAGA